jgi:protein AbiQ
MIPVSQGNYSIIDFKSLNLNYQFLFYKEHEFCKSKQDIILSSATKIYEKTLKKGAALSKFHCDFVKLEMAMKNYH